MLIAVVVVVGLGLVDHFEAAELWTDLVSPSSVHFPTQQAKLTA